MDKVEYTSYNHSNTIDTTCFVIVITYLIQIIYVEICEWGFHIPMRL